jgi:hypothetical protein
LYWNHKYMLPELHVALFLKKKGNDILKFQNIYNYTMLCCTNMGVFNLKYLILRGCVLPNSHYQASLRVQLEVVKMSNRRRSKTVTVTCTIYLWSPYRLAKWSVLCWPKDHGRLGIQDLQIKNKALLGKWLSKLLTEENIWQTLLKRKYIGSKALSQVLWKPGDSYFWAGLMDTKKYFFSIWIFLY